MVLQPEPFPPEDSLGNDVECPGPSRSTEVLSADPWKGTRWSRSSRSRSPAGFGEGVSRWTGDSIPGETASDRILFPRLAAEPSRAQMGESKPTPQDYIEALLAEA